MNFAPTAFTDLPPEERKKKGTICGAVCCVLILAIIGGEVLDRFSLPHDG